MPSPDANARRPLSPHLQVYRWPITMAMSILHRATGIALYVGTLLVAWWLVAAASGPEAYDANQRFMGSILGQLVLFGYTWALMHHLLGGIRHMVWDTGHGFEQPTRSLLAKANAAGSAALTILLWIIGYIVW